MIDTHEPLKVPVGERVLGRMFDVFGVAIDGLAPVEGGEWRSVHATPIPLMRRTTASEVFVTGTKAIDVLAPLERGGESGLFGGAGVGKTVLITELIPTSSAITARKRVLRHRRALPGRLRRSPKTR